MAYSVASFHAVKQRIEDSRSRAETEAEARRAAFHRACPEGAELDAELQKTGMKLFRAICTGTDREAAVAALREENRALLARRGALLRASGFPEDYTEAKYQCPACRDSGYVADGRMCECMRRALVAEEIRRSGIGHLVDAQNFDNFDLSAATPRVRQNFELCRAYAERFDPETSENLLFSGATGLGKTHLSTAVAARVIERGYRVVYESMLSVVEAFQHDRFHSAEEPTTGKYFDAELLILDDVGAELPGAFNTTVLYQLINERQNDRLPTVINTNLSGPELTARYDARISSRLIGGYRTLLFDGSDHRML